MGNTSTTRPTTPQSLLCRGSYYSEVINLTKFAVSRLVGREYETNITFNHQQPVSTVFFTMNVVTGFYNWPHWCRVSSYFQLKDTEIRMMDGYLWMQQLELILSACPLSTVYCTSISKPGIIRQVTDHGCLCSVECQRRKHSCYFPQQCQNI